MAGRRIGEVFVAVEADTSLFRAQAIAGVTKALAGIDGKIPVTADTAAARAQIASLKARMTDLNKQLAEVTIGANGKPAEATIRRLQLELKKIADIVASITMQADTTKLDAAIAREEATLAKLQEQASGIVMDADAKRITTKLAVLDQQIFHLRAALGAENVLDVDARAWQAKVELALAEIEVLNAEARSLKMDADDTALLTKIAASEAAVVALKAELADLKLGGAFDLATLGRAELALLGVEEAAKKLNPELGIVNTKLIQGAGAFGRFGIGALGARVALFGGLSAVSGWHIALDTIVEGLAVIVPALLTAAAGLAAFGIAGSDAALAVYNRMLNLHTVMDATGATIPPFTRNLENLHATVRPQVWQLYGDAISVAGTQTGLFNKLAVSTGGVIDRFAAKITILATSGGNGLSNFFKVGAKDLEEFGRIATSLGDAFGKLIQVTQETHIAEVLLNIVGAAAKLFDEFTKIPLPILATVIAIHGIYLWSGLAATAMTALLRPFGRMAAAAAGAKLAGTAVQDLANAGGGSKFARLGAVFSDLGTNLKALPGRVVALAKSFGALVVANPWIVLGVLAVAALTTLAVFLLRAKSATDRFVDSINTMVSKATDLTVINTIGAGLAQTTQKLATSQKTLADQTKIAAANSKIYGGTLADQNANLTIAKENTSELTAEHTKLAGQLTLVTGRLAGVSAEFGTHGLAGAMALAALAGVNVNKQLLGSSKDWAVAVQQINGLVQGYANMGQGTTQLANDLNVLTIAQSDQLKNVSALNSAFDNFTKIVAGPTTGFLAFANTLKRFGSDAGVAGAEITGLGSGFTVTSKKMTDASLQLQTDFQDTFNAATQMADAMRLTGTASDKQVGAIKNVVQVMIPMAGTSKIAAAEISSLAQEAGGPATTNLQTLSKWAGKTKDPLSAVQKAANDAGISFSNMSLDAQKLGTTLSQDLSKDMATAVENAVGLQGALNKFALAVQNGTTQTAAGHSARDTLNKDLAELGIKGPQASAVIAAITNKLSGNSSTISSTESSRQKLLIDIGQISTSGKKASTDLGTLTSAVVNQGARSDAERGARAKLIADLEASGANAKTATGIVDTYIATLSRVPKNVQTNISAVAHGSGTVVITGTGTAAGQGNVRFTTSAARGMYIAHGTTPTADDVLAMVSKGELIVPANMVKAGAVDHLRGRLPGFAAGGFVGLESALGGGSGATAGFESNFSAKALAADIAKALTSAKAKSAAAAGGGGGGNPGPGGPGTLSAAAIENYWTGAGGPGGQTANIAQAITVPESGRRPSAVQQGQPYSTTGWGLWQITPGNSEPQAGINGALLNPHNNAIAAVAKYRGAGSSFTPWTTYVDGLYRPYLISGGPGGARLHGAAGGLVPGYAAGGTVTAAERVGQTYLNAWRSKHGGGFGAAWGPIVVNQQIAAMAAAEKNAQVLSKASGLTSAQHKHYTAVAVDDAKRLAVLNRELSVERTWRGQLGATDTTLAGQIKAAGNSPALAKNVTSWKAQEALHVYTIGQISKMLGYSDATIAAMNQKGTVGPGGAPLPPITHTYGGDVSDLLGAFISSVAPFALGGMVQSYDQGGWLKPGLTMAYNGTGRNEAVGRPGGAMVTFEVTPSGSAFDAFLISWLKKNVKVKGGGSVQKAWGSH